jgi:hypothetical protein
MERILRTSVPAKSPYRLVNIDWPFLIFWLTYFSIILGAFRSFMFE